MIFFIAGLLIGIPVGMVLYGISTAEEGME